MTFKIGQDRTQQLYSIVGRPGTRHDKQCFSEIINDGYKLVKYISKFAFKERCPVTIIDAGAYRGYFAAWALCALRNSDNIDESRSKIISIEANEVNFKLLEAAFRKIDIVETRYGFCCGKSTEMPTVYMTNNAGGGGTIYPASKIHMEQMQLKARRKGRCILEVPSQLKKVVISDVVREVGHIDFMKVDIEGGEFEVVKCLFESGQIKHIDNLAMEIHGLGVKSKDDIKLFVQELKQEFGVMTPLTPAIKYGICLFSRPNCPRSRIVST